MVGVGSPGMRLLGHRSPLHPFWFPFVHFHERVGQFMDARAGQAPMGTQINFNRQYPQQGPVAL